MPSSLTGNQVRQQFIDFFVKKHEHTFVASSPVVPHGDATLMFANAGMNQFKPYFLGTEQPQWTRVANTQKCIRAGGKHNDLEDVGKDTYHHTFFEMLGNWSFGNYFKKEAIAWAWELLVDQWGLDPERLHATYFEGDPAEGLEPDEEARKLWLQFLPADRVHPGNKKDNFWEMGDTGPCGPCSEVHYDGTPDKKGGSQVNADNPDVIEIWNLVFIQFNRDQSGSLSPLPAKHVDTGMGFERITRVLQGKDSNYDTDVFGAFFTAIQKVTSARAYQPGGSGAALRDPINIAYRVIADHIRTLTFALTDGAQCSNEGRGYVLRRILRRAVRYGWQTLNVKKPFLHELVPTVVQVMGDAFPELKKNPQAIAELIHDEEQSFGATLERGIKLFEEAASRATKKQIAADDAFMLHDTFGFPLDLTQLMAEERGMTVDEAGFKVLMDKAREQSRGGGSAANLHDHLVELVQKQSLPATEFVGYDHMSYKAKTSVRKFDIAEHHILVTGATPFYAESGGQVGDTGTIQVGAATFRVTNTQKVGDVFFHVGKVESGTISDGEAEVSFNVDEKRRRAIMANHTTTHVMNRALRMHVNENADQKGSLVDDEKLRFDFSQNSALTDEQLTAVEKTVNDDIAADLPVYFDFVPQEQGKAINGLRAVFGEKYPPKVRVVSIGVSVQDLVSDPNNKDWPNYSIEFCGGTHLAKTGDAEGFVILSEESVSKGVRRITAATGSRAHKITAEGEALLHRVQSLSGAPVQDMDTKLEQLSRAASEATLPALIKAKVHAGIADLSRRQKEYQKAEGNKAAEVVIEIARELADKVTGPVIVEAIEGANGDSIRIAMDILRKKHPEAALLLGGIADGKIAFIASVPKPLIDKGLKAGDWVREVAKVAGGGGGGRPDMAQAGGKDPAKLGEALEVGRTFASSKV